jgi:hypothetical protein
MKGITLIHGLLLIPFFVTAQAKTASPGGNKKASVAERVGITDITIHYDRPGVKGREGKIWGGLVHYGFADLHYGTSKAAPWRAGANENTTIEFSTDVMINGQWLGKGKYGFFIAMGKENATLIFSKDNNAWGSFFYNPAADALRTDVVLKTASESTEWLKYEFSEQTDSGATVSLLWEKMKISFIISVDLKKTQVEEYRNQVNNGSFYRYWQNMQEAADYCLTNDVNTEEGLVWAEQSVNQYFGEANFRTLSTYAGLLEKSGRKHQADSVMKKALALGTATQLFKYGDGLDKQKKYTEALAIFKMTNEKYPKELFGSYGMAKVYAKTGKLDESIKFADNAIRLSSNKESTTYLEKFKADIQQGKDLSGY